MIRIGKTGTIRRTGKDWDDLVRERFEMDRNTCDDCKTSFYAPWPEIRNFLDPAHVISRGAGGPDTLENLRTRCRFCHTRSHNCGGKPVPAKEHVA
jgi:5-methylcytosine-specific restriction endonuclease McrA